MSKSNQSHNRSTFVNRGRPSKKLIRSFSVNFRDGDIDAVSARKRSNRPEWSRRVRTALPLESLQIILAISRLLEMKTTNCPPAPTSIPRNAEAIAASLR